MTTASSSFASVENLTHHADCGRLVASHPYENRTYHADCGSLVASRHPSQRLTHCSDNGKLVVFRHPSFLYFILHIIKEALAFASASSLNQRLPILPGGLPPSTFGVCGLNCCVRHGNRWIPAAIATEFGSGFVS